jgi:hypothetical protein
MKAILAAAAQPNPQAPTLPLSRAESSNKEVGR